MFIQLPFEGNVFGMTIAQRFEQRTAKRSSTAATDRKPSARFRRCRACAAPTALAVAVAALGIAVAIERDQFFAESLPP